MDTPWLFAGQFLSLSSKLVVSVVLLTVYFKSKRPSSLFWAFGWIAGALGIAGDALGATALISISEALFSSSLFFGSLQFLSEEIGKDIPLKVLWASPPLVAAVYGVVLGDSWASVIGVPYGVSAFFVLLSGAMIAVSTGREFKTAREAALAISLLGIHKMNYPILRWVEWFAPIGFALGALLTVVSAYFMAKMVLSTNFIGPNERPSISVEPGIKLASVEEYQNIKGELAGYPVLAFIRELTPPDRWKAYFITSIPGENTIPPTNLPRILELAAKYLRESEVKGITGVVVIDGVEYLIVHNGIVSVTRFLGALRDLALLRNGRLIVVIDGSALERRDYLRIKRVLEGA